MWQVKEYPIELPLIPFNDSPVVGLFNFTLKLPENNQVLGVTREGIIEVFQSGEGSEIELSFLAVQADLPALGLQRHSRYLGSFSIQETYISRCYDFKPFFLFLN